MFYSFRKLRTKVMLHNTSSKEFMLAIFEMLLTFIGFRIYVYSRQMLAVLKIIFFFLNNIIIQLPLDNFIYFGFLNTFFS